MYKSYLTLSIRSHLTLRPNLKLFRGQNLTGTNRRLLIVSINTYATQYKYYTSIRKY